MSISLPQVRYCCETCGQPIDHVREDDPVAFEGVEMTGNLLRYQGKSAKLKRGSAKVVRAIFRAGGQRSSEALIMESGTESDAADEILRVYVSRIRRALEAIDAPFVVRNVHGWGYELHLH